MTNGRALLFQVTFNAIRTPPIILAQLQYQIHSILRCLMDYMGFMRLSAQTTPTLPAEIPQVIVKSLTANSKTTTNPAHRSPTQKSLHQLNLPVKTQIFIHAIHSD